MSSRARWGAVTLRFRLELAYRCGGSPGIKRLRSRSHRIPVSLVSPFGRNRAPDNPLSLMHDGCGDNTASRTAAQQPHPGAALTRRSPDGVLAALMASLTGESEEGMWYVSGG
jgi:hypothetical protein